MIPEANIQPSGTTSCCTGINIQKCPDGTSIEAYCCDEATCTWQYMPCPNVPSNVEPEPSPSVEPTPEPSPSVEPTPEPSPSESEPSPYMMIEPCDEQTPEPSPSVSNEQPEPQPSETPEPIPAVSNQQPEPEPNMHHMSEPCDETPIVTPVATPVTIITPVATPTSTPVATPVATPVSTPVSTPVVDLCSGKCTGNPFCPDAKCKMVTITKVIPGTPTQSSSNCGSSGTIIASGTITETPSGISGDGTITIENQDINKLGSITVTPSGLSGSFHFDEPVSASGTITDTPSGIVASGTITATESNPCNSNSSESNSTIIIVSECQWVCPSYCNTWCSSYSCPSGTSLVSCGPHPNDLSSCLPICSAPECVNDDINQNTATVTKCTKCLNEVTNQNTATECASGEVEIWRYENGSCSKTCPSITCDDPCSPNCVPICSLGGSRSPCINSRCSLNPGVEIPVGEALASPAILSSCSWTPSYNSYNCVSVVTNKCYGKPMCPAATCETDANGNPYWDNTICNKDCTKLNQSQCPGGFLDCSGGPGICTLIGDNCTWICPINPCQNASGYPLCQSPAPVGPPFDGCLTWKARCIVSNVTAFPAVCGWDVQCTEVSKNLSGPCNITNCGNKPNTSCPGSETWACSRPSGVGLCQWVFSCPPNLNLSIPCSQEECNSLYLVQNRNTTVCGINPTAKPQCVRNCKGICENLTPCYPVYQPPTCQRSPCGDVCYDPRWLTGEQIAPDSFNASLINVPSSNCSLCLKRCSGFLLCGRPSYNPLCQFSHSDAYDKCVSRCTSLPILSPPFPGNQTNQCFGRDPCKCNYSICTFVTALYSTGNLYAECLSNEKANQASSLPGYQILYSSVALPTYCPLIPSSSNTTTNLDSFLNRVNNCTSDQLQQNLLNSLLNMTNSTNNFTDYIPQISVVLVPSVNTSINSANSSSNSTEPSTNSTEPSTNSTEPSTNSTESSTNSTNSSNSTISTTPSNSSPSNTTVSVGCVFSLHGDKPPSNTTLANWCQLILQQSIATTMQIPSSQLIGCILSPVGSSGSSSSLYSKRSIENTGFSGTYVLTSTVVVVDQNTPVSSLQTITVTTPAGVNSPSGASSLVSSLVLIVALVVFLVF